MKRVKRFVRMGNEKAEKKKTPEVGKRLELTSKNFDRVIGHNVTFVKFYLKWCSHCKVVDKAWRGLIKHFAGNKNVTIAQVDCEASGDLCSRETNGCPTLNLYSDGMELVHDYHEDFSLESLIDVVTENMKGGKGKKEEEEDSDES